MNTLPSNADAFDPLDDPRLQSLAAELQNEMRASEMQAKTNQQTFAAAVQQEQAGTRPPQPELDPVVKSAWDRLESQFGLQSGFKTAAAKALDFLEVDTTAKTDSGFDWKGLRDQAVEEMGDTAAEQVAHLAKRHVAPPPLPKKLVQWYYAVDDESQGPVTEDELIQLLSEGTVKMSSLVWNKTMSEWSKASDTPLANKVEALPPPLPKAGAATAKKPAKSKARLDPSKCPACGHAVTAADRFCPDCGKPLKN